MKEYENNCMIAEFMDLRSTGMSVYKPSEYKYHTSYEWLMPVVHKINGIRNDRDEFVFTLTIGPGKCTLVDNAENVTILERIHGATEVELLYRTVIDSIKWINDHKGEVYGLPEKFYVDLDADIEGYFDIIFMRSHEEAGTKSGDITPSQAFQLSDIKKKLKELVTEVIKQNL